MERGPRIAHGICQLRKRKWTIKGGHKKCMEVMVALKWNGTRCMKAMRHAKERGQ